MELKISPCSGEGQGECRRCADNGIWNRHWTNFLYHVEGMEGCYCSDCIAELKKEALGDEPGSEVK